VKEPYRSIPRSPDIYTYPDPGFDLLYPFRHKRPTPRDYFIKKVSGFSLSKNVQKNKFLNTEQKLIFEYASRLGAFITYIFIQALRPNDLKTPDKRELVNILINSSIDLDSLFDSFRMLITQAGLTHLTSDELRPEFQEYNNLWELDKKRFDKLSEIFKTLYPSIYEGLENFWYQSMMYWMKVDEANSGETDCKHTWEPYEFFKIGSHHRCRKCKIIVTDAFHKKNSNIR